MIPSITMIGNQNTGAITVWCNNSGLKKERTQPIVGPLSMLNGDVRILTGIVAKWLNVVITQIIHPEVLFWLQINIDKT